MQNLALKMVTSQLPTLIETYEDSIQKGLEASLGSLKEHPDEAKLFLTNWRKLDAVVEARLGDIEPKTMTGGDLTGPTGPTLMGGQVDTTASSASGPSVLPEASLPIIEPTGPTGPTVSEETGPSFMQSTGPTGPTESIISQIQNFLTPSGPTGPAGGKKHRKRKTAKQHKKRTHRVKHRKH